MLTAAHIRSLLPRRLASSHKGDNGRVLIIGGSRDYFGAPILNAMGALFSGADLVYLLVPKCNFDVSRCYYPDFIVRSLRGDALQKTDWPQIQQLLAITDCLVIGSGMVDSTGETRLIASLLEDDKKTAVCDALAIEAVNKIKSTAKSIVITPHVGEFERFIKQAIPTDLQKRTQLIIEEAKRRKITIVLKGPTDIVADPKGKVAINETGNAGMTVGGSGDVLAGLIGGLIAQDMAPFDAGQTATFILGSAGDGLYKKKSYGYTASDLVQEIPYRLKSIL